MKREVPPYSLLANAIILQTVRDYKRALKGKSVCSKRAEDVRQDCEVFFHSSWFLLLTNVDGDFLIDKIQEQVRENRYRKIPT